jgi:Zn-dependent metalloprotease
VPGGDEGAVRRHLASNGALYGLPEAREDLRLERVTEGLLGRHFHFRQYAGGIPVLHAGVTVSMSHSNGAVYLVHCATVPADAAGRSGRALLDSEGALDRAWGHVSVQGRLNALPACELVWVPVRDGLRLAYATAIACSSPLGAWEVIVDAETGRILDSANRMRTDSRKRRAAPERAPGSPAGRRPAKSRAAATAEFLSAGKAYVSAEPALTGSAPQGSGLVFDPDPKTALADDSL